MEVLVLQTLLVALAAVKVDLAVKHSRSLEGVAVVGQVVLAFDVVPSTFSTQVDYD